MKKVLITGGTGLVGNALSIKLKEKGYEVSILSRGTGNNSDFNYYKWDIGNKYIDLKAIENQDYIIHLAGENLGAKRWSKLQKQKIYNSRVKSSELLFDKIVANNLKLKAFITASAVGIYPSFSDGGAEFNESSDAGNAFVSNVCKDWEKAADNFKNVGIRTVKIRTGLVQDVKDPALKKTLQLTKFGILPVFGKGKQYYPWIHIHDLVNIYIDALENENIEGPINAVAPEVITNLQYIKTIKMILKKPFIVKIPAFAFKLLFGEMSEIILKGTKIKSELNGEFIKFKYPTIESAMNNLLDKS
ncbi:MAG: TIGR01777 family oxidoreductase [Bacteroidales bacterium]|nr:TIGR01777 family oxidoreductase [Bacteroidales bacterium]